MTVADPPKRWWSRPWWALVPESWYLNEAGDQRRYRDRDRDTDLDLDDTRSFPRRRWDDQQPQPRIEVPFGAVVTLAIYLITQLVGGVWWAATLQSNQHHEIADRAKEEQRLWQTIETYRLQVEALRREMIRSGIKVD